MKKILSIFSILVLVFLVGCSSNDTAKSCDESKYDKNPVMSMQVKGYGTMEFELDINQAPSTVANFIDLANKGFYNGLDFHRIDQSLGIIQGGDPQGDGTGGPGYTIKGEVQANNHCNKLENTKGSIAMARSQSYDSAGSQFFINFKDNSKIFTGDNQYAVFGHIIKGEDVMEKIGFAPTVDTKPEPKIIIEKVSVNTFDLKLPEIEKTS